MLNNFIYAKLKSLFEEKLVANEVPQEAIVFIEDTKEIWNHGTYFDGSTFDPSNIEASILELQNLKNGLATVATSGSYNDLIDRPEIPNPITESTIADWGFTKGNLTSVDIDEEVVESPEMEYATKGYVDKAIEEIKDNQTEGEGVAELMVEVTYNELVTMRNNSELIPGMKYRMIDYETVLPANDTWHSVAGHPFDLILTALNENTLSEMCSAIQSVRDTEGYFANSNLGAWEIHYCLDNDVNRFGWAAGTRPAIQVDLSEIGAGIVTIPYSGGYSDGVDVYARWDFTFEGEDVSFLTLTDNPIEGTELFALSKIYVNGIMTTWEIIEFGTVKNIIENEDSGKGVIYRMIDEYQNDVYYDFKNVLCVKNDVFKAFELPLGLYTFTSELDLSSDTSMYGCAVNNSIKFSKYLLFNLFAAAEDLIVSNNNLGSNCFSNAIMMSWNTTIDDGCVNILLSLVPNSTIGKRCRNITIMIDEGLSIANDVHGDNDLTTMPLIGFTMFVGGSRRIVQNNQNQILLIADGSSMEPEVLWPVDDENNGPSMTVNYTFDTTHADEVDIRFAAVDGTHSIIQTASIENSNFIFTGFTENCEYNVRAANDYNVEITGDTTFVATDGDAINIGIEDKQLIETTINYTFDNNITDVCDIRFEDKYGRTIAVHSFNPSDVERDVTYSKTLSAAEGDTVYIIILNGDDSGIASDKERFVVSETTTIDLPIYIP